MVSDSKNFRPGSRIFISKDIRFESISFTENGILFRLVGSLLFDFLEKYGEMPLPPYINYTKEKEERYQTFFAQEVGSAAAPTASLHFTPELVKGLEEKGVEFAYLCLHVGLGTFKPVYEPVITDQKLHFEPMQIPHSLWKQIAEAKQAGKTFLPVGTTMIRFLESLPYIWCFLKKRKLTPEVDQPTFLWREQLTSTIEEDLIEEFIPDQEPLFESDFLHIQTRLFIRPGIPFYIVDELITNFHLPKSSLMMLISAFLGREKLLEAYQYALDHDYKFYSFGDGMWIKKNEV